MTPFRHPVVGLDLTPRGDLSEGSRTAIAHVRWLLQGTSARCTLLHSRAPDEVWDAATDSYQAGPPSAPEALEGALAELRGAGIQADLRVTDERALLALLRSVIRGPCDLVIVGKRGPAKSEGPALGSTAAKLLRKCPSAVWAVRPGTEPPPRRLLAATDLTPVGSEVLYRATQVATRAGAELHVVHTLQLTMEAQLGGAESTEEYLERERASARERIRAELRAQGYGAEPELHVGLSSPSRAILECAGRFHPDLVVMGTISRGGVPGLLLGNTAERLLTRLDVSLLAVKPADFVCPVRFDD